MYQDVIIQINNAYRNGTINTQYETLVAATATGNPTMSGATRTYAYLQALAILAEGKKDFSNVAPDFSMNPEKVAMYLSHYTASPYPLAVRNKVANEIISRDLSVVESDVLMGIGDALVFAENSAAPQVAMAPVPPQPQAAAAAPACTQCRETKDRCAELEIALAEERNRRTPKKCDRCGRLTSPVDLGPDYPTDGFTCDTCGLWFCSYCMDDTHGTTPTECVDCSLVDLRDKVDTLSAGQQLCDEYADGDPWGEHPDYSREDWQDEAFSGETNLGYWDWVAHQTN